MPRGWTTVSSIDCTMCRLARLQILAHAAPHSSIFRVFVVRFDWGFDCQFLSLIVWGSCPANATPFTLRVHEKTLKHGLL